MNELIVGGTGGLMVIVRFFVADWGVGGVESVTVNVCVRLLVLVGTPLITPVAGFNVKPVGSRADPPARTQL